MTTNAAEMRGITKRFGPLIANNAIDFTLGERQINQLSESVRRLEGIHTRTIPLKIERATL